MNVDKIGSISTGLLAVIILVRAALEVILRRMGLINELDFVSVFMFRKATIFLPVLAMLLVALFGIALALVLPALWRRLRSNAPVLTWLVVGVGAAAAAFHVALGVNQAASMGRLSALYGANDLSWLDEYVHFLVLNWWIDLSAMVILGAAIFLIGWVGWRDHRLPGWMNTLAIVQAFALIYTLIARRPLFNGAAVMLFLHVPWYIGLAFALSRGVSPDSQAASFQEEQP